MEILIPILAVTIIGIICAVGLSVASHVMAVRETEDFQKIRACLPGANCGACGYSGCDGYARALAAGTGKVKPNLCVPGGKAVADEIASLMGVEAGEVEHLVAVVRCSGDCGYTKDKHAYVGIPTCKAARQFFAGPGSCTFGCLGFGDCMKLCPNAAISVDRGLAHVNPEACVGCGLCVRNCPQQIITIRPYEKNIVVLCSNTDKGAQTRKACTKGCIGCKKCEKVCTAGAIRVTNNMARIDFDKCKVCGECEKVCTTSCISDLLKPRERNEEPTKS